MQRAPTFFFSETTTSILSTQQYTTVVRSSGRNYRLVQVESHKKVNRRKSAPFSVDSELWHTSAMSPCQPANERCVFVFVFRHMFARLFCFRHLVRKTPPKFSSTKNKRPSLTSRQGLAEHVCIKSGSIFQKTAWTFGLLRGKHVT